MLIEFTVGNFRSFKDPVTLSMVAANLRSKDKRLDEENTIKVDDDLRLLTSAAIYGANASGKSNLVHALSFMHRFVLRSASETQLTDKISVERFRLSTETDNKPSFFEIVFLLDGTKYRYGFEATQERVTAEWLFFVPTMREAKLFEREMDDIIISSRSFKEGRRIAEKTRPNALFLSVVAQFNGAISGKILTWFRQLNINPDISDLYLEDDIFSEDTIHLTGPGLTAARFHRIKSKEAVLQFVTDLDLGMNDIQSERVNTVWGSAPLKEFQEAIVGLLGRRLPEEEARIKTIHRKYDAQGSVVGSEVFDLADQESMGTQTLFSLALPILDALGTSRVVVIDELDAHLHPLITRTIISLFNSKQSNPNNAQLIFTTHDTNLLSNRFFRRDQIWFTEKDRFGVSYLYSLAEFKVRNDASFESDYIEGRYGAIPFIHNDLQLVVGADDGNK